MKPSKYKIAPLIRKLIGVTSYGLYKLNSESKAETFANEFYSALSTESVKSAQASAIENLKKTFGDDEVLWSVPVLYTARTAIKVETYPGLSIAAIYRTRVARDYSRVMANLVIALVFSIVLSLFKITDWGIIQVSLFIPFILLFVDQTLLDYRILKNLYLNNERETRDLIEFIIKESSKIDFTDNGQLKKILSEEDIEEIKQEIINMAPGLA